MIPRPRTRIGKGCTVVLFAAVALRLSPYLFPIHADDLQRGSSRMVRFYDREGNLLGTVLPDADLPVRGDQACQPVTLAHVAPVVAQAFVAAEDRRFYRHHGVDWLALGRALMQDIKARHVVSGGSTITMQLARLLHPKERTPAAKLREIYTAWRLEAGMSKAQIMEAYLNRAPMGSNIVGVGAAARTYFGIPPSALNASQASLLAALPQDPIGRDPYRHPAALRRRQRYVLRRMQEEKMMSAREAADAARVDFPPRPAAEPLQAWQFFFFALHQAPRNATNIVVTLDRNLQEFVTEQARQVVSELADRNLTNAAVIVVRNDTEEILAYLGSLSYFDIEHHGRIDGAQALRQPGSSLKPFLYEIALEQGYTPATVLPDLPTAFPLIPGSPYEPTNYDNQFHGPVRARVALANSYNVPACYLTAKLGVTPFLERLRDLGFTSLRKDADYYGVGLVLGNGEVSLYQQARAYASFARGGRWRDLRCLLRVNGRDVNHPTAERTIGDKESIYLLTDMLSDPYARAPAFGTRSVLRMPFQCAVKTGTSSHYRDNWTIGYTRDYTVAVWAGDFEAKPLRDVSGVAGAGPLFARIMVHLYEKRRPPAPFPRPAGIVTQPVCALSGLRPSPACPQQIEELFRQRDLHWYEAHPCTWHRRTIIDTRTGKPADDHCPPQFRREAVILDPPAEFRTGN